MHLGSGIQYQVVEKVVFIYWYIYSPPGPTIHLRFCYHIASVVYVYSPITIFFYQTLDLIQPSLFNLLIQPMVTRPMMHSCWMNLNQILQKCYVSGPQQFIQILSHKSNVWWNCYAWMFFICPFLKCGFCFLLNELLFSETTEPFGSRIVWNVSLMVVCKLMSVFVSIGNPRWPHYRHSFNIYSQPCPCSHLYQAVICIQRPPFLVWSQKISYELNLF